MTLKRLLAVLMTFGLVAAACSDDDGETTAGGGTETTAAAGGTEETTEAEEGEEGAVNPEDIETDYGVTEDTIRVGLIADLSGIFAPLVVEIVEAHEVFFEMINEEGGIGGRMIEPVVVDAGYDVPRHIELYQEFAQESEEGVAMISLSAGSPHTAAVAEDMIQDNIVALPLTWYSGWGDPEFGAAAAEMYTNYCLESMNALSYMQEQIEGQGEEVRLAIISFPGEYGQDGATGAKIAAEALGLNIVYDGEAQVVPGADQTPIISELVNAQPNLVFATINPGTLSEIFGGARAQGLEAMWTGNSPTFSYKLLGTDLADDLGQYYKHSTYTQLWGAEGVEGMDLLMTNMAERRPEMPASDNYITGWTYARAAEQILSEAARRGDLTRAGIVEVVQDPEFEANFRGLAPNQTWGGENQNEYVVRESFMYDVDPTKYNPLPVSEEGGSTGLVLAEGPFASETAQNYEFDGPCFAPQG